MRLFISGLILLLSGCAIVPQNIQVEDKDQLVSYQQVISTGEASLNKPARWGGLIANVENLKEGSVVEVVDFSLNHYGKPNIASESIGRFKVKMKDFLDPVVFQEGRVITFTGTVTDPIEGAIGEHEYTYPTLQGTSFHLWQKETIYDVSTLNFGFNNGFYNGFHNGYYGNRFYGRGYYGFGNRFYGGSRYGYGYRNGFGGFGNGFGHSRVRVIERAPKASPNNTRVRATRSTGNNGAFKGVTSSQLDKVNN